MPQNSSATKSQHHRQRRDQAQFLANDRENKIGVMLRDEAQFLAAVAQAQARPAAGPKGDHGLPGLVAGVRPCSVRDEARPESGSGASDRAARTRPGRPPPARPAARDRAGEPRRSISIVPATAANRMAQPRSGSTKTSARGMMRIGDGNGQALLESAHLPLVTVPISRQEQYHGQFGQFRRLEVRQAEEGNQSNDAPPPRRPRRAPPWPPSRCAAQKPK